MNDIEKFNQNNAILANEFEELRRFPFIEGYKLEKKIELLKAEALMQQAKASEKVAKAINDLENFLRNNRIYISTR
jgi:hypothetical protein